MSIMNYVCIDVQSQILLLWLLSNHFIDSLGATWLETQVPEDKVMHLIATMIRFKELPLQ